MITSDSYVEDSLHYASDCDETRLYSTGFTWKYASYRGLTSVVTADMQREL